MDSPDRLDDPVPLMDPATAPRVVTRAQAHRLGYPDRMIGRRVELGRWLRLGPGLYLTAPPVCATDRLHAAVLHGGPGAVVSGAAALSQYGFRSAGRPMHELVLVGAQCPVRTSGRIRIRRTTRLPTASDRPGPPLAPVARAVTDHVRTLNRLDDVIAVVGESIQRALATPQELSVELAGSQRNGSRLFRAAQGDVVGGAWSVPEARAARLLRAAHMPPFEQNVRLDLDSGTFHPDFLWRDRAAILEIDSQEYHFDPGRWRATMRRHAALETAGYSVIHLAPSELRDAHEFVTRIRLWLAACARRGFR